MEKFVLGVALGAGVGALLVANNGKTRKFIKKSQEELQAKLDQFLDEKTEQSEESPTKTSDSSKPKKRKA